MNNLTSNSISKVSSMLLATFLCSSLHALAADAQKSIEDYGSIVNNVRHVNETEASEILQQYPDIKVLDVRLGLEYNRGHIPNAVNINYYSFSFSKQLDKLDKDATWLVYCRSGVRSSKSLSIMRSLGFESILHLDGGTSAWAKAELPLKKS